MVDPVLFEAAQAQLEENRRRKRDQGRGSRWLLQGLTVCRRCGYAYYGKAAPRSTRDPAKESQRRYQCTGADGYRFGGTAVCTNRSLASEPLEQAVWERVRALLEEPECVADEYRRRLHAAQNTSAEADEAGELDCRMAALRRGIGRLIDSYAEGVIEQAEFEPRIAGLKTRMAQLRLRRQMVAEAAEAERELTLVIGQLEDFAAKVGSGLDQLDGSGRREIIRAVVRRIEIDGDQVEVVFRVPPRRATEGPITADSQPSSRQHCTDDRGEDLRPARVS